MKRNRLTHSENERESEGETRGEQAAVGKREKKSNAANAYDAQVYLAPFVLVQFSSRLFLSSDHDGEQMSVEASIFFSHAFDKYQENLFRQITSAIISFEWQRKTYLEVRDRCRLKDERLPSVICRLCPWWCLSQDWKQIRSLHALIYIKTLSIDSVCFERTRQILTSI